MTRSCQQHTYASGIIVLQKKKVSECYHESINADCDTCQCKVLVQSATIIGRKKLDEVCPKEYRKRAKDVQIVAKKVLQLDPNTNISFSRSTADACNDDVLYHITSKHKFSDFMNQSFKFHSKIQMTNLEYKWIRNIAQSENYAMDDVRTITKRIRLELQTAILVMPEVIRFNCGIEKLYPFIKGSIQEEKLVSTTQLYLPRVLQDYVGIFQSAAEFLVLTPAAQDDLFFHLLESNDRTSLKYFNRDSPTIILNRADDGLGVYKNNTPLVRGAFTLLNNPKRLNDPDACIGTKTLIFFLFQEKVFLISMRSWIHMDGHS